jgi:cytochrome b561
MHSMPPAIVALIFVPLILWRVVSRIKRLTTRQRSQVWRHRTTLVFFPLLVVVLAVLAVQTNPIALAGLVVGLPLGALLGRMAIGKVRFEQVGDDEFYFTPHAPIGMIVAALFLSRMAWRGYQLFFVPGGQQDMAASPLTQLTFGALAGYYIVFALGLLAWRKRSAPVPIPA